MKVFLPDIEFTACFHNSYFAHLNGVFIGSELSREIEIMKAPYRGIGGIKHRFASHPKYLI